MHSQSDEATTEKHAPEGVASSCTSRRGMMELVLTCFLFLLLHSLLSFSDRFPGATIKARGQQGKTTFDCPSRRDKGEHSFPCGSLSLAAILL